MTGATNRLPFIDFQYAEIPVAKHSSQGVGAWQIYTRPG
jgi:hypothetical protein